MGRPQGPMPQASIKDRAAKMRKEAARSERKTATMIFVGVIALLVIAIAVVAWLVTHRDQVGPSADAFGKFNNTQPVVIYKDQVSASVPEGVKAVDEYVSYTCSACAAAEGPIGSQLVKRAQQGEFALRIHFVPTAMMAFTSPATAGGLIVADSNPEKFAQYHEAIFNFTFDAVKKQDGSVLQDASASVAKVQEIMRGLGVAEDKVKLVNANLADSYLEAASKKWADADIKGRDPQSYGTPMYVVNDTMISRQDNPEPDALIAEIEKAAK